MFLNTAFVCTKQSKNTDKLKLLLHKFGFSKIVFTEDCQTVIDFYTHENKEKSFLVMIDLNDDDKELKIDLLDFIDKKNIDGSHKVATLVISDSKKNLTPKFIFKHDNLNIIDSRFDQAIFFNYIEKSFSRLDINIEASKIIKQRTDEYRVRFLENINKRIINSDNLHAEFMLRKKLEFEPDWAIGKLALASILIDKKCYEEAKELIKFAKENLENINYICSILLIKIDAMTGAKAHVFNMEHFNNTDEDSNRKEGIDKVFRNAFELLIEGKIHSAEEKFKKVLSINPNLIDAKIGLVKIAQKRERRNEVKSILMTLPCPDIIAIEFNLKAIEALKKGDLKSALKHYKESDNYIMTHKKRASLNYNIGLLYVKLNDFINAKKYLMLAKEGGSKAADLLINKIKDGKFPNNLINEEI